MQLAKYNPLFSKVKKIKKYAGRNNQGRITVRHQGGGHKQLYRKIDSNLNLQEGIVSSFEYDPNRTTLLAKILYSNVDSIGLSYSYISATKNLKIFDRIQTLSEEHKSFLLRKGDTSILTNFEIGDHINNVEAIPGRGSVYARSAGTYCRVLQQYSPKYIKIKMPSGEEKLISTKSSAILGEVSNEDHYKKNIMKAGRSR
jgi:large subunit ribosomal protein L2